MELKLPYRDKISLGFSLARSAGYTLEQLTLPVFEFLATGQTRRPQTQEIDKLRRAYQELYQLLKKDSENIDKGIYPISVLKPEKLTQHFRRYPRILIDGYQLSKRRQRREAQDFSPEAEEYLADLPTYYKRNFHYQSGGYLTKDSADLYEHQVEILFSGAADAMRRLILPLIKAVRPGTGEGLHFLEVAAGTGRLTRFMKLAYPKARITVLDLSYPYLKKAQENLKEFDRIDFVQGAAESLPFQDKTFNFVYSCFLFHELPLEISRQALAESFRVLKEGGQLGIVDSLQKQDAYGLEWALEQFPVDFHEPFYKTFTQNPLEDLLAETGFTQLNKDRGFFAKALLAQRPISS